MATHHSSNYWENLATETQILNADKLAFSFEGSNPTDYIILTPENMRVLRKYAIDNFKLHDLKKLQKIPGDIFKSQTIPLPDIVFRSTIYTGDYSHKTLDFFIRCVVVDNQLIFILNTKHHISNNESTTIVLTKQIQNDSKDPIITIDSSYVYIDDYESYDIIKDWDFLANLKSCALSIANSILINWYVIQTMMLHPTIKDRLLVRGPKERLRIDPKHLIKDKGSTKSRKRKAPFIKYTMLNADILNSDVVRKRHTMCWYVMGHWRKHGTGRVWVNGYWKGPLRELKKNLDNGREIIVK